jgi:hypothetical protein
MGSSFYSVGAKALPEDWSVNNRFYHAPSESHFEMLRRGESLIVRRYQLDQDERQVNSFELPVTHVLGSGIRARSYLHQTPEGRLIELPVSWYSQEQRWAMAPGFDRPKHPGFSRTVNHKCMFCHNGYPETPPANAERGAGGGFAVDAPGVGKKIVAGDGDVTRVRRDHFALTVARGERPQKHISDTAFHRQSLVADVARIFSPECA